MTALIQAADPAVDTDGAVPTRTPRRTWWKRFRQDRFAVGGLIFLGLLALAALAADWIAPYDPNATSLSELLEGPSWDHLLGTDALGRDVLSRLLVASRTALFAGAEAVVIGLLIGVPIGLVVGYFGGWWDRITMRLVDALMSVPGLIVAFAIISVLGPSLLNAMLAVGILFAIRLVRLMRGVVLSVREELYVDAARLSGPPTWSILARTVFPNVIGPIIVQAALYFSAALLIEAMLSFLGVGVQRPQATWGTMLAEARQDQFTQPFLPFPPGIALTLTVLAFNLVGDGLRESFGKGGHGISRRAPKPRASARRGDVDLAPAAATRPSAPDALLSVRDLTVAVPGPDGPLDALRSVDLDLYRGEVLGLVGESGSGKSLTALSVMGLLAPGVHVTRGSILLDGEELTGRDDKFLREIRGKRVGMIFQEPLASLNPSMTVGAQISETLRIHEGLGRRDAQQRAVELLERVGVPNAAQRAKDHPHQFSGGMAQRAMIAMALACGPDLLLADEPTTALDVTTQAQVIDLLRDLVDDLGIGVVVITHDMGIVAELCDRAAVMYAGEIVETGTVQQMFERPLHPYTSALLRSMPRGEHRGDRLPTIPGRVPNLQEIGDHCAFADRCPHAEDRCRIARPTLADLDGARAARCVRVDELVLGGAS